MSIPQLPQEIISDILYKWNGLKSLTASIMTDTIEAQKWDIYNDWEDEGFKGSLEEHWEKRITDFLLMEHEKYYWETEDEA